MANDNCEWIQDKVLGRGGFGVVLLFRNILKNERIVVKYCHRKDMSPTNTTRWCDEVKILSKLNHPNIIKALEMPDDIIHPEYNNDNLPPLCMEFCEGGDLRSYFRKPSNCCGLFEVDVRKIASDLASALQHLHEHRIIHRDVKPENIVLHKLENETIYKLIDLGYAKELDYRSMAQSYVGTLQYLAPEFFKEDTTKLNYSRAVDYWSYGLILIECIVGKRPFLHDSNCINSLPHLFKKPDNIIFMTAEISDPLTNVELHDRLPKENHLSPYLIEEFQVFLQKMLKTNDKERGRSGSGPDCWDDLENILQTKVVNIYSVPTNQVLSVSLESLPKMAEHIVKETEIRMDDFFLLLKSGIIFDAINDYDNADKFVNNCGTEEVHLFLFEKSVKEDKQISPLKHFFHNDVVILQSSQIIPSKREMVRKWSHVIYLCQQLQSHLAYLEQAVVALTEYLREIFHYCRVSRQEIRDLNQEYISQSKILISSLNYDIERFRDFECSNLLTINLKDSLNNMKEELLKLSRHKDEVNKKELQFLPSIKNSENFIDSLKYESKSEFNKILVKTHELYDRLRECKTNDDMKTLRSRMVALIKKIMTDWDIYTPEINLHIAKIVSHSNSLLEAKPLLSQVRDSLKSVNERLLELNLEREKEFMNFILPDVSSNIAKQDTLNFLDIEHDDSNLNIDDFIKSHEDDLRAYDQFINTSYKHLKKKPAN